MCFCVCVCVCVCVAEVQLASSRQLQVLLQATRYAFYSQIAEDSVRDFLPSWSLPSLQVRCLLSTSTLDREAAISQSRGQGMGEDSEDSEDSPWQLHATSANPTLTGPQPLAKKPFKTCKSRPSHPGCLRPRRAYPAYLF